MGIILTLKNAMRKGTEFTGKNVVIICSSRAVSLYRDGSSKPSTASMVIADGRRDFPLLRGWRKNMEIEKETECEE